uniref:Immunoglobulin heavy variable 9-2 n=1 Tax=Sparus aurata TaxID=8175 RepID=A0A671USG1_SPAAU
MNWIRQIMLICVSTGVNSIDLIQPDSKVVQPGQSVTITCQVSGYSLTDDSYATGWIRQCEGKPMDWIFHMWGGGSLIQNNINTNTNTPNYASSFQSRFTFSQDVSSSTQYLEIRSLTAEDSAVYFCARETQ